jgi:hypothetical protein
VALYRKRKQLTDVLAAMNKNQKLLAGPRARPRKASMQQMRLLTSQCQKTATMTEDGGFRTGAQIERTKNKNTKPRKRPVRKRQ